MLGFKPKVRGIDKVDQPSDVDAKSAALPAGESLAGKIVIRTIEEADKEPSRALLKAHHASTLYADFAFSDELFEAHAAKIYSKPENMVCLVAERIQEDSNQIVGLLWASAGHYSLSKELILITCHVIAIDQTRLSPQKRIRTFLRLIKAVKLWSDTRGAHEVLVHVTTGTNFAATDRLLRRSGAKCIGGGYVV